jgi:serine-type D-Ala-D-Ala carboxypeptidase
MKLPAVSSPPIRAVEKVRAPEASLRVQRALHRVLTQALKDGAFPGAVAVVGLPDGRTVSECVGTLDGKGSPAVSARTLWDLASLTKVVGTTTAVLQLVEAGKVSLDAPVARYLPEFQGPGKSRVTVRQLLLHSSGLPSSHHVHTQSRSAEEARRMLLETPLVAEPGTQTIYSDVSAFVAGALVERVSGQRLDAYLRSRVFLPLGMHDTGFRPPASKRSRTAPTENDAWRGRHLRGEVHDETAFALHGVSGNAGLFSTAEDLTRFARMLLAGGVGNHHRILSPSTVDAFSAAQSPTLPRSLGWEVFGPKQPGADHEPSSGHRLSPRAFGHTGFTGTSLWVDPETGVFVLLLSNRINPDRSNRKILEVRPALADAVMEALKT